MGREDYRRAVQNFDNRISGQDMDKLYVIWYLLGKQAFGMGSAGYALRREFLRD